MSKVNVKKVVEKEYTHGGAVASKSGPLQELTRSVYANMLWEDEFYESGEANAVRIRGLVHKCKAQDVAALAIFVRSKMKLRHIPLLLVRELARHAGASNHPKLVADTLFEVIQRPDEISEFLAIYWKEKKQPLSAQVKKGLARSFTKFNEYSLAKYSGKGNGISLKDAMFMVHAKPSDVTSDMAKWDKDARGLYRADAGFCRDFTEGEILFGKVVNDKLTTPDTWEVQLSGGADKKDTFERLMSDNKLGALAFLRNLRNMEQSGVSEKLIKDYADKVNVERILPFRFLAAARYAPRLEGSLEKMMFRCVEGAEKLPGKTVLIVDVSGSMSCGNISAKSDLSRLDGAYALAMVVRELCEDAQIYCTAGSDGAGTHKTSLVPPRRGFALGDACKDAYKSLGGGGIFLKQVMEYTKDKEGTADRVIVLTDEQDCDHKCNPKNADAWGDNNYIINVASYKNGIAYDKFVHISGWSESVIDFIRVYEQSL